jgi:hypothetical protein
VDGRAVGIQRLVGYDCQKPSAPFLNQSNINLAYTYSEQPLVCEPQASVAARCLAAATQIRPAAFDPAREFAGINVEIESPETFRVTLPDGRQALVAPGESTPKRAVLNGVDIEGSCVRYIQMTDDMNEICGLGPTGIAGIASFSGPSTFRLKRTPDGEIGVRTNTGISLTDSWVAGNIRRIEARTLDNQWLDVTARCDAGSISLEVVREYSERNQRSLVDFRINGINEISS